MNVINHLVSEPILIAQALEDFHEVKKGSIVSLVFTETGRIVLLSDYKNKNRRVVFPHQIQLN